MVLRTKISIKRTYQHLKVKSTKMCLMETRRKIKILATVIFTLCNKHQLHHHTAPCHEIPIVNGIQDTLDLPAQTSGFIYCNA